MPEHPAELQLHRRFLECRGIALPVEMPEGLTVLWSKLTAVMEVPNMLDTIHHGTSVDIWALTKVFGFPVLVWSTDGDANYWIASMEQVTETEALRLADQHPQALQVLHQPMGHTGHYSLLLGPRPDTPLWQPTPWLQMWHREGARALQQHLGMFRVQSPRVELAGPPNLPTASPATAEAASEPGNPTAPNQDPWPAPATPPCSSGSEVGFADTESVVSWNSHQSSEGSIQPCAGTRACMVHAGRSTLGANSDHQPTVLCQTFAATIRATRSGRVSRQHVRCPVSSLPLCLCRLHVVQRRTAVRRRIALERSVDCAGSHLALQQRNLLQRHRCLSVGSFAQPACTRLSALPRRSCKFLYRSFESSRRTIGPSRWMECRSSHLATLAGRKTRRAGRCSHLCLLCRRPPKWTSKRHWILERARDLRNFDAGELPTKLGFETI